MFIGIENGRMALGMSGLTKRPWKMKQSGTMAEAM